MSLAYPQDEQEDHSQGVIAQACDVDVWGATDAEHFGGLMDEHSIATVLDVVENHFGSWPSKVEVLKLSVAEVRAFAEVVGEFAQAQAQLPVPPRTTYLGGWFGANWLDTGLLAERNAALLYYDRCLVDDPLASFFFERFSSLLEFRGISDPLRRMTVFGGPRVWGEHNTYHAMGTNTQLALTRLAQILAALSDVAPLIKEGVIQLRSQWPVLISRRSSLETAMRFDVADTRLQAAVRQYDDGPGDEKPLVWDTLRGMRAVPGAGVRSSDERWVAQGELFYLNKSLAVADAAGATYAPSVQSDFNVLLAKAHQFDARARQQRFPVELLKEIARLTIPDMNLSPKLAVQIRQSEQDFREWRDRVSRIARAGADDTPAELAARVDDELGAEVARLDKTVNSSRVLSAARDAAVPAVISVSTASVAEVLSGGSAAVVGAGVTGGVLSWLWNIYGRPRFTGGDAVLAALVRRRA